MGQSMIRKKLGEILIAEGKLHIEDLERALQKQKITNTKLGAILIEMDLITEEEMIQSLAVQYQYPFIKIANYEFTKEALALIPRGLAIKLQCLPMDKIENVVSFMLGDPMTAIELSQHPLFLNCRMNFFVTTPSTLKKVIQECYGA
jgi:type IV pilus assembly protein PilB